MDIQLHLDDLMVRGPPWGYLPKLTKSILVVSPWNVPRAEDFYQGYGIQVVTRILCLGRFVGMKIAQYQWLEDKVAGLGWRVSTRRPHTRACRNPSSRSGPLCRASPRSKGWRFSQWRTSYRKYSSRPYFGGPRPRSLGGRSLVFRSSRMGFPSPTLLRPPGIPGQGPVSSQDTSLQHYTERLSLGQGIMPF